MYREYLRRSNFICKIKIKIKKKGKNIFYLKYSFEKNY